MNRSLLVFALPFSLAALLGVASTTLTSAAPAPENADTRPATAAASRLTVPSAVSADRARLDVRRQLYELVDALVQAGEFERARTLLDEDVERYGDEFAPEWHDLAQSYRLMADCLEHPSTAVRERAESFARVSRAIGLKSLVLSDCSRMPR